MTPKERYRAFCRNNDEVPLTHRDWWLDSVCGDDWDVVFHESNGEICASMPFYIQKFFGLRMLLQPPFTQSLGPLFMLPELKSSTLYSKKKKLMYALIQQLPKHAYFSQNWLHTERYWLPFYWKGFAQTTRYTYVINDLVGLVNGGETFTSAYKNKVKNAQKIIEIKEDLAPEEFYALLQKTFERQNKKVPFTYKKFLRHHDAIIKNRAGKIFYGADDAGQLHSAMFLTWDSNSSYVHFVGEDPIFRSSSAGIALIAYAIRYTRDHLKLNRFDFEGSMIEAIETVRRDCGAVATEYYHLSKFSSKFLRITYNIFK